LGLQWVSADGFGQSWQRFSLPTIHNELVSAESHPPAWKYCDGFLNVAANHTFAGDPTAKVDALRDGGPLIGWAQVRHRFSGLSLVFFLTCF